MKCAHFNCHSCPPETMHELKLRAEQAEQRVKALTAERDHFREGMRERAKRHLEAEEALEKKSLELRALKLAELGKQAEAELEVAKAFHDVAVKERDRNLFTAQTIGADLAEIGRLCEIKDDEYPLKAVKRVVNERNEAQFERMETGRALMEMLDERDELLQALIRVTLWDPRSTEAACRQDYDFAAAVLKKHGVKREKP